MKNRFLSLLLAISMALVMLPYSALAAEDVSGTWGGNITYVFEAETGTLTISGEGAIKEQSQETGWQMPPWYSMTQTSDVKKVIIEEGVTTINAGSFGNFWGLKIIELPKSLEKIGEGSFVNCNNLSEIYYAGSKADWQEIDFTYGNSDYFWNTAIYFADPSVKNEICGENANFDFDASAGTLTIKGEGAMYDYAENITPWVYNEYNDLITKIIIEEGITYICEHAFAECENAETVEIPSTITEFGKGAFLNCSKLKSIEIPNGITNIKDDMFKGCSSLKTITLPASVTYLGDDTGYFDGCYNLFDGCSSLEAINVDEDNKDFFSDEGVLYRKTSKYQDILVYPAAKEGESYDILDGTTDLGLYAFNGCKNLVTVNIPVTVSSNFADSVFYNCQKLKNIYVNSDSNQIWSVDGVFYNRWGSGYSLVSYPIGRTDSFYQVPQKTKSIMTQAFALCTSLKNVNVPFGTRSIEYQAFYNCTNLEKITLPHSLESIDQEAFKDCNKLKDVYYSGTQAQWEEIWISDGNECLKNATIHFGNAIEYDSLTKSLSFYSDKEYEDAKIVFTEYKDGKLASIKFVKTDIVETEKNEISTESFAVTGSNVLVRIMGFENNSVTPVFNMKFETIVEKPSPVGDGSGF